MTRPDPKTRPAPQIPELVRTLEEFGVVWLLAGSYVLTLHGADLDPNDLDVVVRRDPANLARLARCLDHLDATPAWYGEGNPWIASLDACRAWRPEPATIEHLDHLFVTRLGMLDVPFEFLPPYEDLLDGATQIPIGGVPVTVCDPRRVLRALEARDRKKDRARSKLYADMRKQLGMA